MMDDVALHFAGPYSWPGAPDAPCVFEADMKNRVGIYLWTVPLRDGHLIYYVGETGRDFGTRLLEHYLQHAAGMYHIYSSAEFAQGEKVCLWPGRYDVADRRSLRECVVNYPQIASEVHQLTRRLRFFLGPLECDDRMRRRVEAAIAQALYETPGRVGAFQDRGIRYEPRKQSEVPVRCVITSAAPLLGLPAELLA
jgi:hypothetical protein